MSDLQAGRARLDHVPAASSPAAASATATRSAPAKAGRARCCSTRSSPTSSPAFFARPDTFALGICNGCQMLAALAPIIPGAEAWPRFTRNRSEQFEARLSLVEVLDARRSSSPAWPAAGSRSPSRTARASPTSRSAATRRRCTRAMRFVDHHGRPTEAYPSNPNGSPGGLTAVTTADGRFTALMPHPERVFRNVQMSWTLGRAQRAQPLDADVRERAAGARLGRAFVQAAKAPAPTPAFRPEAKRPPAAIPALLRHASSAPCGRCPAGSRWRSAAAPKRAAR